MMSSQRPTALSQRPGSYKPPSQTLAHCSTVKAIIEVGETKQGNKGKDNATQSAGFFVGGLLGLRRYCGQGAILLRRGVTLPKSAALQRLFQLFSAPCQEITLYIGI